MKKEEVKALEKNGIDHKRIESLKRSLKGYKELKKELTMMEKLVLNKDEEIEKLEKKLKRSNRKNMLAGIGR